MKEAQELRDTNNGRRQRRKADWTHSRDLTTSWRTQGDWNLKVPCMETDRRLRTGAYSMGQGDIAHQRKRVN